MIISFLLQSQARRERSRSNYFYESVYLLSISTDDLPPEERAAEIARKTLCRVDKYAEYIKTSASFEKRYREHFGRSYEDDLEKHSLEKGEER